MHTDKKPLLRRYNRSNKLEDLVLDNLTFIGTSILDIQCMVNRFYHREIELKELDDILDYLRREKKICKYKDRYRKR